MADPFGSRFFDLSDVVKSASSVQQSAGVSDRRFAFHFSRYLFPRRTILFDLQRQTFISDVHCNFLLESLYLLMRFVTRDFVCLSEMTFTK